MTSYNRVIIAGNLTHDPETRQAGNSTVADFGLAINRKYKSGGEAKEETTFVDVECWGKTAELVSQYLSKGRQCLVEGRLRFELWEDQNGGGKRSKLKVVAESVQFIGSNGGKSKDERQEPAGPEQPQSGSVDDEPPF